MEIPINISRYYTAVPFFPPSFFFFFFFFFYFFSTVSNLFPLSLSLSFSPFVYERRIDEKKEKKRKERKKNGVAVLSDLTGSVGGRSRGKGERDAAVARVMFPRAGKPLLIDPFNPCSIDDQRFVVSNIYPKPILIPRYNATTLNDLEGRKKKKKKGT